MKKMKKQHPILSLGEEIGNAVTHGVGALLSIVAYILLLQKSNTTIDYVSASIYIFGMLLLYTMSTLYHSFRGGSTVKKVFRRFDHSSIYFLIGGTFAPILLSFIQGTYGWVFFIIQWSIIITGVTLQGVFGPNRLSVLHLILYLTIGWSGIIMLPKIYNMSPELLYYILGGGIAYTIGVIPYLIKVKYSHFIWHFFVLAGTIIQFIGIYMYVY